jgi:hypothetical protein
MNRIIYYGLKSFPDDFFGAIRLCLIADTFNGDIEERKKLITAEHKNINREWGAYTKQMEPKFLLVVENYLEFDI